MYECQLCGRKFYSSSSSIEDNKYCVGCERDNKNEILIFKSRQNKREIKRLLVENEKLRKALDCYASENKDALNK